jgi:uncharacterized protein (TIGR04255 family)
MLQKRSVVGLIMLQAQNDMGVARATPRTRVLRMAPVATCQPVVGCEVQCEAMEAHLMPMFSLTPVDEVHLHRAPLAKVLMQVQFSRTPQLVTDLAESVIADALGRYPVRRRQLVAGTFPSVVINGQPIQSPVGASGTILLFSEPTGSWQVTITEAAVSLETTEYSTREDFCDRALEVFQAIAALALPPVVDRVGLRYIDRLAEEHLSRVPQFVIPQLQVLYGSVEQPLTVHHSVTDSLIEIAPTERLQVRSGLLPAGGGFDPALPIVQEPTWVLDMDVYTTQGGFAFDADELTRRLRRYAETAYAFFRFATTDAFQEEHRGEQTRPARNVP